MNTIKYLKGDATSPQAKGNKLICHVCNDLGGWGKGFVLAISKRWPKPEKDYRDWHRHRAKNDFSLGNVQFIEVSNFIEIGNMIAQRGMKIRYQAVETCLSKVADRAIETHASVHMPRIGCGLAGGKWSLIEPIIEKQLISRNVDVYIYDFE